MKNIETFEEIVIFQHEKKTQIQIYDERPEGEQCS